MKVALVRRVRSTFLFAATASCLAACVTIGQPFPSQGVPKFGIGTTTQADIQKSYGSPFRTGVDGGDVTWTYVDYKLRMFGQQCTQDLVIHFNANGTVKSFAYNTSSDTGCK